ncbi:MAG: phytanoyl-CoA dioxygenase family protein [Bdellovibrionota bacterium]
MASYWIKLLNRKTDEISTVPVRFSSLTAQQIADKIRMDGFYRFEHRLDEPIVDQIVSFAKSEPSRTRKEYFSTATSSTGKVTYEEMNHIDSPRFDFDQLDMCKSKEILELIFDLSFCNIAQEYFGSTPIMDLFAMWWSKPCENKSLQSYAAQMFHYDMDRIKFLKFFVYLTDVTPDTGPHCFVRGSHNDLKKNLRRDGRFDDIDIEHAYGKNAIVELCAPKGTIFAVDTRGLHKGVSLKYGQRLMLQLMYANSTFGQDYQKININSHPSKELIMQKIAEHPLIFGPLFQFK